LFSRNVSYVYPCFRGCDDAWTPGGQVLANLLKPANKAELVDILTYHVVAGNVSSHDLKDHELVATVEGKDVSVSLEFAGVFLNIGTNGARVITADVEASNGVVHIIDVVLTPPSPASALNIVKLAQSVPDLSTLVTAVVDAGLVATLSGTGPFTVLAPSNEAFAKLDPALLKYLLDPAHKTELVAVLTYHVIAGPAVYSYQLSDGEQVPTVNGAKVFVELRDGQVYFDRRARVLAANNGASNGVVHLISDVLIPPRVQAAFDAVVKA
jgi:uncharacterized surface protein with fasciclin (FAS1) repeats